MGLQHQEILPSEGHFLMMDFLIFHIVKNTRNLFFTVGKGTKCGLPFEPMLKQLGFI